MALLISIYYLLGPIRQDIVPVLHTISHTIENSNHVFEHHFFKSKDKTHHGHSHEVREHKHSHALLSFLSQVIKEITDNPLPDESFLTKIKYQKHINETVKGFFVIHHSETHKKEHYFLTYQKTKKGYPQGIKIPPQLDT